MYTLEIDITEIVAFQKEIQRIESLRVVNLDMAASALIVRVKDHISKGKTASGKTMESKSSKKEGKYSKRWGSKRKKKGLRVDSITLSYTGDTIAKFGKLNSLSSFKNEEVIVGFKDETAEDIAAYNNAMFGDAYDVSDKEIDESFKSYLDEFNSELLRP